MSIEDRIVECIGYNPITGMFFRKKLTSNKFTMRDPLGKIDNTGYHQIGIFRKRFYAHRIAFLIMTGEWPAGEVDHINGDRLDNRWINLRDVSRSINQRNRMKCNKDNKLNLLGVTLRGNTRFRASMTVDNKSVHLGYYNTSEEAHEAYLTARTERGID